VAAVEDGSGASVRALRPTEGRAIIPPSGSSGPPTLGALSGEVAEVGAIHTPRQRYHDEGASVLGPAPFEEERPRGAALSRDDMVREALAEIRG
jgi:hypothetical protein